MMSIFSRLNTLLHRSLQSSLTGAPANLKSDAIVCEPLEGRRLMASITGTVYSDSNVNQRLDPEERRLEGFTVFIDANRNSTFEPGEHSAKTDSNGRYTLSGLAPGRYPVRELVQTAWKPVTPRGGFHSVFIGANGNDVSAIDFGNKPLKGRSFVNFDPAAGNAAVSQFPPQSAGAEGQNQFVSINNTLFVVQNHSGGITKTRTMADFFAPLSPSGPLTNLKIIYDSPAERYLVTALDTAGGQSRILIAGSRSVDAKKNWNYHEIDIAQSLGVTSATASDISVAISAQTLYITADVQAQPAPALASRLWIIKKSTAYSKNDLSLTLLDPALAAGLSQPLVGLRATTLIGNNPDQIGTFLVAFGTSGVSDSLTIIQIDKPNTTPIVYPAQILDVGTVTGAFTPPPAAQLGSSVTIDTGSSVGLTNSTWRNGNIYTVATVVPPTGPDAGQATVHWFRVRTKDQAHLRLEDQGDIGAEDLGAGTSTFDPAVMVDRDGFMAVGFAASGPLIHPGTYAAARLSTDLPGTVRSTFTIAAGQDVYVNTFGSISAWGHSAAIILDTADLNRFWVLGAFSLPSNPLTGGQWGQQWFAFTNPARIFPVHD
jgi:hypothetical protein